MNKRKIRLFGILLPVILILAGILIWIVSNKPYHANLPAMPDFAKLPEAMVKQIKAANKAARRNFNVENAGKLGLVYHSNAFYEEAKQCYLQLIETGTSEWKWYYYLGYLYSELGDPENVIKYLGKAIELNPGAYYASYYLGEAYANIGNNDKAEEILNELSFSGESQYWIDLRNSSNFYPVGVYALFRIARLYIATSRLDEASEVLQTLTNEYPEFGPGFRLLSTVYAQQNKAELSNLNLARASDLIPFTPPLDTLIDQLALISQSPEFVMKQMDIATISNRDWAKKLFDHAITTMSDNQFLLSKGIKLYLNLGVTENLTQLLNQHITVFADDFNELMSVATLAFQKGMFRLAAIYMERCLKSEPRNYIIKQRLSLCYLRTERGKESAELITGLLKDYPDSIKVLSAAASVLITMKDNENASLVIQRMESIFPDYADINLLKAKIALINADTATSDKYYMKSYKDIRDDMEIIMYVGMYYKKRKLWDKAIEHFKSALSTLPNEPVLLEQLGDLFMNCPVTKYKDPEQAEYYLARAYYSMKSALFTKIAAGKNLANLYIQLKNINKAKLVLDKTLQMAKSMKLPQSEIQDMQDMFDFINTVHEFRN